jgi:MFS family permease
LTAPTTKQASVRALLAQLGKPLQLRDFRFAVASESCALLAGQMGLVTVLYLTLHLFHSALVLGLLLTFAYVARAVVSLGGGVLSDRHSPRRVMVVANWLRFGLLIFLAVMAASNSVALWVLYVVQIGYGIIEVFYFPAIASLFPRIVPEQHLEAANSCHRVNMYGASMAGPLIAGALVSMFGVPIVLIVAGLLFAVSAVLLMPVRTRTLDNRGAQPPQLIRAGFVAEVREGALFAFKDPLIRLLVLSVLVVDFSMYGPYYVGIPSLATRISGVGALGLFISAYGVGALVGTVIAGVRPQPRRPENTLVGLFALIGGGWLLMSRFDGLGPTVVLLLAIGGANGFFNVSHLSWLQRRTPSHLVGRVRSVTMLAEYVAGPLSLTLAGALVDGSHGLAFALAGLVGLGAAFVLILASRLFADRLHV